MSIVGVVHRNGVQEAVNTSFMMIASNFILESLQQIIIWLIVMFSVIVCDLITGCRKSLIMKEEVRFSTAWRRTMGKMVTYFSFVIMVVMINQAVATDLNIDKWAILFICFIEGSSIISNILKPKGYSFNALKLLSILAKKLFKIEDTTGIITKNNEDEQRIEKQ